MFGSNRKLRNLDALLFSMTIIGLFGLVFDYGFQVNYSMHLATDIIYILFAVVFVLNFKTELKSGKLTSNKPIGFYLVFFLASCLLLLSLVNITNFLLYESVVLNFYTAILVFILIIFELSARLYNIDSQTLHPALVFVLSFVVLICIGALLLMAPNATVSDIDFIDALFTSTSAVCVTGLATLNTGGDFTIVGQIVIMFLIQLGALGMLSFTSLFGLFFKGASSFGARLDIKDMINADTIGGTFKHLIGIVLFVFVAEALGAIFIYNSLEIGTSNERLFFSIFHAISAFCNAGFSTYSDSLFEMDVRYNYHLHLVVGLLIIFGGIGYGVVLNLIKYFIGKFNTGIQKIFRLPTLKIGPTEKQKLTLNSRIVLFTSLILIAVGAVLFFALEYDNVLEEHSGFGKVVTSLFGSITTRTAGFNTVDTGMLHTPTIFIVIILMWIGASPGSTGGGIKTTTFAISILNVYQQVFGKKDIVISYRKIAEKALRRATSIISLSLLVIGVSSFLLILFDEDLGVVELVFESFSAFSTVGLSMGITSQLSDSSKIVIIFTMLIGRVGLLTLLTGLVRQLYSIEYSPIEYPEEEIFIN